MLQNLISASLAIYLLFSPHFAHCASTKLNSSCLNNLCSLTGKPLHPLTLLPRTLLFFFSHLPPLLIGPLLCCIVRSQFLSHLLEVVPFLGSLNLDYHTHLPALSSSFHIALALSTSLSVFTIMHTFLKARDYILSMTVFPAPITVPGMYVLSDYLLSGWVWGMVRGGLESAKRADVEYCGIRRSSSYLIPEKTLSYRKHTLRFVFSFS